MPTLVSGGMRTIWRCLTVPRLAAFAISGARSPSAPNGDFDGAAIGCRCIRSRRWIVRHSRVVRRRLGDSQRNVTALGGRLVWLQQQYDERWADDEREGAERQAVAELEVRRDSRPSTGRRAACATAV